MGHLEQLLDMAATESIEGPSMPEDHPDEAEVIYHNKPEQYQPIANLPSIRYDLELVKKKDGSLEWVE
jgi:hypothetical protein